MAIKRSILTQEQIKDRLKIVEQEMKSYLNLTNEEVQLLIKNNKDLIHVDPAELKKCLDLAKNTFLMEDHLIKESFYNNPVAYFDSENLREKAKLLNDSISLTAKQFGFFLFNNTKTIKFNNEVLQSRLELYAQNDQVSHFLIRNLLSKTHLGLERKEKVNQIIRNITLLKALGFTEEEIAKAPTICGNRTKSMLFRYKISKLEGLSKNIYLQNRFMRSDASVYARRKAYEMGVVEFPIVYEKEEDLVSKTGFSTTELQDFFPITEESYREIDKEFAKIFPKKEIKIQEAFQSFHPVYKSLSSNNNEVDFSQLNEEEQARIKVRQDILETFGVPLVYANQVSEIYELPKNSLIHRLKIAKLHNFNMYSFMHGFFRIPDNTLYARWMAKENKKIDIPSIYIYENQLKNATGFTDYELRQEFKFNHEAIRWLGAEFANRFPEIEAKINGILKEYKITKAKFNQTKVNSSDNKQFQETTLDVQPKIQTHSVINTGTVENNTNKTTTKENEKLDELIKLNYKLLLSYGFTKTEIEEKPKALLVKPDKLEARIKLARIHGRTNNQFLTKDYASSEETIYARTCALYLSEKSTNALVYGTSAQFEAFCGKDSKQLKDFFPFDERANRMINRWYKSITNKVEDESEK